MSKTHTDKRFQAKYHPIADKDGWPIANFIILMDRIHNGPTRAELHIDVEAPEHTEEQALRKAQEILAKQYATTVPGDGKLEVRLMRVEQVHDTMHLDIPVIEEAATQPLWSGSLLLAAAALWSLVQFPYSAPAYFFYAAPLGVLATAAVVGRGWLRGGPMLGLVAGTYLFLGGGYVFGVAAVGPDGQESLVSAYVNPPRGETTVIVK